MEEKAEPQKPKSRLLAMKNRLRQKQKKESAIPKSSSAGGIASDADASRPSQGSKPMTRSRTYEGKILDSSPNGKDTKKKESKLFKSKSTDAELKFSKLDSSKTGLVKSQTVNGKLGGGDSVKSPVNGSLRYTEPGRGSRLQQPSMMPSRGRGKDPRVHSEGDSPLKPPPAPVIDNGEGADYVENIRILKKYNKKALEGLPPRSPQVQRPSNLPLDGRKNDAGQGTRGEIEIRTGVHLQEEVPEEGGFQLRKGSKQNFTAHEAALGYLRTASFSAGDPTVVTQLRNKSSLPPNGRENNAKKSGNINKRHSRSLENLLTCGRFSTAENTTIFDCSKEDMLNSRRLINNSSNYDSTPSQSQQHQGQPNIQHILQATRGQKVVPPHLQARHKIESDPNLYGERFRGSVDGNYGDYNCRCNNSGEYNAPIGRLDNIREGLQYHGSRSSSCSSSSNSDVFWSKTEAGEFVSFGGYYLDGLKKGLK